MTATPPLGDGRLRLEPLRVEHADAMVAVLADAGLYTFTGGTPPTLEHLRQRYGHQVAGSGDPSEEWHNWVVYLGAAGPAVGFVQATVHPEESSAELAWVVGERWQGRGIAREAAALVLDHLLGSGRVRRVVADVHPEHVASQRVAASLGLAPTDRVVDGEVQWEREDDGRMRASLTPTGIAHDRGGPPGRIPVVLLHAGIADRRMWDPQWEALTAGRDAVRLDLRGFGESDRPPVAALDPVADVLDTLDHLGVVTCHLVGSSFGAGVAVEVALTRPAAVRSLLLAPPGGSLLTERTAALADFAAAENEAMARGDLDAAVEADVATWVVGPGRDPSDVDPSVTASVRVMQRRAFEVEAGWGDGGLDEVELDPPAVDRYAEVGQPVLLVVGGHDLDTVHLAADRLEAGLPQVRRVDRPATAHLPSMEEPETFLRLLLDWVAAQD
ncbi:MAG TPA: GNAT family N-acetyltransferase [Ornithinibacter sp.]|nr:GNAT family N-acetyltransferase [Ornithinibacter sp.]